MQQIQNLNLTYTTVMDPGKASIVGCWLIYKGGGVLESWTWLHMAGSTTLSLLSTRHRLFERGCIVDYNVCCITAVSLAFTSHNR